MVGLQAGFKIEQLDGDTNHHVRSTRTTSKGVIEPTADAMRKARVQLDSAAQVHLAPSADYCAEVWVQPGVVAGIGGVVKPV